MDHHFERSAQRKVNEVKDDLYPVLYCKPIALYGDFAALVDFDGVRNCTWHSWFHATHENCSLCKLLQITKFRMTTDSFDWAVSTRRRGATDIVVPLCRREKQKLCYGSLGNESYVQTYGRAKKLFAHRRVTRAKSENRWATYLIKIAQEFAGLEPAVTSLARHCKSNGPNRTSQSGPIANHNKI